MKVENGEEIKNIVEKLSVYQAERQVEYLINVGYL